MRIYKKKKWWSILIFIFSLCVLGCGYIYAVYHGYLLLNNPSKHQYPIRGVDVSHYQGDIDWQVLADNKIQFAYIKATEGSNHIDDKFAYNWSQAKETNLLVGAYHFFSFDSEGKTQAENFESQVSSFDGMLPPVVDVEYYADKKVNPPGEEAVREQLHIYLENIQSYYGKTPVIYSTEEVWTRYLEGHFEEYPLWIRNVITKPDIQAQWTFWQYTNRARLKGYVGEEQYIDMNVFAGDEEEWERWLDFSFIDE